jgi:hypothetical protein
MNPSNFTGAVSAGWLKEASGLVCVNSQGEFKKMKKYFSLQTIESPQGLLASVILCTFASVRVFYPLI